VLFRSLGAGKIKVKNVGKAMRGHFATAKVAPKRHLVEFRISADAHVDVGAELTVEHFKAGQQVDVVGHSHGKGFAGAMKRHNFSGLRATHGVSVSHRSHGSTGQCQDPGRVFKGKKMAGHMGDERVTVQNLYVVETDADRGLIMVRGGVPGPKGGMVLISDAIKTDMPDDLPFPGAVKASEKPAATEPEAAPSVEAADDAQDSKDEGA